MKQPLQPRPDGRGPESRYRTATVRERSSEVDMLFGNRPSAAVLPTCDRRPFPLVVERITLLPAIDAFLENAAFRAARR